MKKLLAMLLALMLVMVSAFALAGGVGEDNSDGGTTNPEVTEPEGGNGGQGEEGGEGGEGGAGGTTTTAPAATTKATSKDPSVDTGYDAETAPAAGLAATAEQTVTVYKHFNIKGTGAKLPAQTVSFTVGTGTVTNSSTITTAPGVTIDNVIFTETDVDEELTKGVTIHLPAYSGVGVYTYPVTETDTNVAGVAYASNLELKITVIQGKNDQDQDALVIAGIALRQNDVKTDTLENDYKANALTVGKTVAGNMGDQNKLFPITVVLTAPEGDKVYGSVDVVITGADATVKDGETTITNTIAAETAGWTTKTLSLSLKHGNTVQFKNLPEGVTYTVVEDAWDETTKKGIEHLTDDTLEPENTEAYKVDDEVTTAEALTGDKTVTITNTKNVTIDTGVVLDTNAYVLIMALALVGVAVLAIRRREEY